MSDLNVIFGGQALAVTLAGGGPVGPAGPTGTLTNNSGVVTTVPAGDGYANPKVGVKITGGGAATDVGLKIDMNDGSLAGMDIRQMSTGRQMRFRRADGLEETYMDSGALFTAKYIVIGAGIVENNGLAPSHPAYVSYFYGASQRPSMLTVHADVACAAEWRGFEGPNPLLHSFLSHNGYEFMQFTHNQIRFARADNPIYVGDKRDATPITGYDQANCPIVFQAFNSGGLYGLAARSEAVGTIGEVWFGVYRNGGLAAASTGRPIVQYESDTVVRVGNSTDQTILNTAGQIVFEIAGTNTAYFLPGGFHPLASGKDLGGAGGIYWRNLELSGAVKVAGNQVVGARGAALPADATDLATALTLINAMKARMVAHGLVS